MELNAVLVRLKISLFGNTRQDKRLTAETVTAHALGKDAGRWVKLKLPKAYVEPLQQKAGQIRAGYKALTVSWDEGIRLMALTTKPQYDAWFAGVSQEFKDLKGQFIEQYSDAYCIARDEILKDTFDAADYPEQHQLEELIRLDSWCEPIPQAHHLIADLNKESLERMQAELEQRNQHRLEEAVRETWIRLLEPIQHMAERLASPTAVFRDSLVGNVNEILNGLPALNVTGDEQLVAAGDQVRTLLQGISAQVLRDDKVLRSDTARQANAFVAAFGKLGQRKFGE